MHYNIICYATLTGPLQVHRCHGRVRLCVPLPAASRFETSGSGKGLLALLRGRSQYYRKGGSKPAQPRRTGLPDAQALLPRAAAGP